MPETPVDKRRRALEKIWETRRSAPENQQWQARDLTPQQERAVEDLDAAVAEMQRWHDITAADQDEKNHQLADQVNYEKALARAIWVGLDRHPVVQLWLAARRSLGDRKELRRFRLSLERGVKKTMSKEDFWVVFEAQGLIDDGHKPEAIRKTLIEKLKTEESQECFDLAPEEINGLIDRLDCSQQNFHRWLRRLKLI